MLNLLRTFIASVLFTTTTAIATTDVHTEGLGPFKVTVGTEPSLPNHVIYRPAHLGALENQTLPIILWGNGGCTDDAGSAFNHLAELASHGYVVFASGSLLSGPLAAPDFRLSPEHFMTSDAADMLTALEWADQHNAQPGPFEGKLNLNAVAVSGHSCGGILSLKLASSTARVKAVVIHNSGIFPNRPERPMLITDKAWLQDLRTPVLYIVGNRSDVGWSVAHDDFSRIAHVPVFLGQLDVGHGGTFQEPFGGDAAQAARQWLDWQLKGDRSAAAQFVGASCGLCTSTLWRIQRKQFNLLSEATDTIDQ